MFRRVVFGLFILFIVGLGMFGSPEGESEPPEIFSERNLSEVTGFSDEEVSELGESDSVAIVGWNETVEGVHENGSVVVAGSDWPAAPLLNVSVVGYGAELDEMDEECVAAVEREVAEYVEEEVVGGQFVAVYAKDAGAWRLYQHDGERGQSVAAGLVERGYAVVDDGDVEVGARDAGRGVWACLSGA